LGGDGARALAGGTDLIVQLKEGRRSASAIVDLKRVPELAGIAQRPDGSLAIGASASALAIARHAIVRERYASIATSVGLIGSLQVQSRASLGGNIANAAPSADGVPAAMVLGADIEIAGAGGMRRVALGSVFSGPGRTKLAQGELLTAIVLPQQPARSAAAYLRFTPRREMDIAIAGAAARLVLGDDNKVAGVSIALASVAPVPLAVDVGSVLIGRGISPAAFVAAGKRAAESCRPISDTRGSADYRRTLVSVLTARALAAAVRQLGLVVEVP
jgi:carbon-monoxide dehydrogenase medium subunit